MTAPLAGGGVLSPVGRCSSDSGGSLLKSKAITQMLAPRKTAPQPYLLACRIRESTKKLVMGAGIAAGDFALANEDGDETECGDRACKYRHRDPTAQLWMRFRQAQHVR